jgi:predicted DNA-binding transcriptional regulator AlpA
MAQQLDLPFSPDVIERIVADAIKAAVAGQPTDERRPPMHPAADRVLTVSECAHRLGMSDKGFRKLCRRGVGPEILLIGERRQGVRERDFDEWLRTRQPVRRGRPPKAAA